MNGAESKPQDWAEMGLTSLEGVSVLSAHFTKHSFERHSHDTFSIGITREGVQEFSCGGAKHQSTPGHVISFNPDELHDGRAGTSQGFGYTMLYLTRDSLLDLSEEGARAFYFKEPLIHDQAVTALLSRAIEALSQPQEALRSHALMAGSSSVS